MSTFRRTAATLLAAGAVAGGLTAISAPIANAAPPECPPHTKNFSFSAHSGGGVLGAASDILTGDSKIYSIHCER